MPLQIKELYIKVTVNSNQDQGGAEGATPAPDNNTNPTKEKGDIVAACVEQVMELLKEKMEP